MDQRLFVNADGELLIIPQEGIRVETELGTLELRRASVSRPAGEVSSHAQLMARLSRGKLRGLISPA
jgi:hypothetical protein